MKQVTSCFLAGLLPHCSSHKNAKAAGSVCPSEGNSDQCVLETEENNTRGSILPETLPLRAAENAHQGDLIHHDTEASHNFVCYVLMTDLYYLLIYIYFFYIFKSIL